MRTSSMALLIMSCFDYNQTDFVLQSLHCDKKEAEGAGEMTQC